MGKRALSGMNFKETTGNGRIILPTEPVQAAKVAAMRYVTDERRGNTYAGCVSQVPYRSMNDQKQNKPIQKAQPPRWSIWIALLALVLATNRLSSAPFTIHVSPLGDNNWSGRLEAPAANGRDGPLATVPAAIKSARLARREAGNVSDGITISLRAGVYELEEPLVLTSEDSGASAKRPFTISAYPGERPIISGGHRIAGWKKVEDKAGLWQAEVPSLRDGHWYFRSLFVNGHRKQRARTPAKGFFRIQGGSPQDKPLRLKFKPGDIRKEWASDGDVEVVAFFNWADIRMQIRAVDEVNHIATLAGNPRTSNREDNARYFIENAPGGLAPGEWYLDRKAGLISYHAEPSEDLSKAEVLAPRLNSLLSLRGDLTEKKAIQHVMLRGLTFSYTDWALAENGYADTQAAIATRGDIRAEAAMDCAVEDCTFTHLAGYALEFGRGCQRNKVGGNEITDVGAGGIRVGETGKRQDEFEQNHSHTITDNHMHHLGMIYPSAVGVLILQSGQNRVAHNHIHDLYYTAISVGWNWGYQETPCRENTIEFNHLHDIGQFMLSDMGAIYTLGIQRGTVIRNNLIHDVNAYTYGGWGLYPDEGSSEIIFENNVVYRTKSAGFHQHYGRENIVRNNIFAFGKEHQMMRTREEAHLSFIFTNNIVYFDSGTLLGGNWSNDRYTMDGNTFFDARPAAIPGSIDLAGVKLEQWRQRGHDLNSLIADPRFVAPQEHDFHLQPNSPALGLGFHPIDLSQVGVRAIRGRDSRD